jgi:lipopolysaccharide biosynthesis glycosyltransferase
MSPPVRFFTSADSRFFVGAAAMLNSLAVSGNRGDAFVLDVGLQPEQRERISQVAEVLILPPELRGLHPLFAKLTADVFWSDGVVVLLDSDMVVTSPLDRLVEQAATGKIAVHPDHEITRGRQFPEMVTTFELTSPLRPQRTVNTAPLAISLDHWPDFLERWRRACERLPPDWPERGFGPLGLADQDALNAILMSEVVPEAIWFGPETSTVHADELAAVQILDAKRLRCLHRGETPVVLHYGLSPKAWHAAGWRRVRAADAYILLLRRLLFARDVGIRARRREVPIWLRPGAVGRLAAFLLGLVNYVRVDLRSRAILLRRRLRPKRR